jgi:MoxR-like ATPase
LPPFHFPRTIELPRHLDATRELTIVVDIKAFGEQLTRNLEKVVVGKRHALELAVVALLCQGHVLIEDVPGVGKTILARSLAKSLDCTFNRIQFTPDMLPSDVTGVSIYNQATGNFDFRPGPVMGQVVLADEINRATPKTQAALLEAMDERQVTVDGVTHPLPAPFIVLATQNPIEYEGTFPLPEAQLDRFLLRLRLGYPAVQDEMRVLDQQKTRHPISTLKAVSSAAEVLAAAESVRAVHVSESLRRYIVEITSRTRQNSDVYLGASPRGSLALYRAGQALAGLAGRDYVLPDDVKRVCAPILAHRIIVTPAARLREVSEDRIIQEIVEKVPAPGGDFRTAEGQGAHG